MDFPMVGIGASAGGLEAVQEMLAEAPPDAGLCYVLVQHLDPNHKSLLPELLDRRTALAVHAVSDGDTPLPDTLFIIPPGKGLSVEDGVFRLKDFAKSRGLRRPIDDFFASLAVAKGEDCACVILSGTGADGSEGLRRVKEAGGLVVAQDPAEARYDGMPGAAAGTRLVDHILPAREIPDAVERYFAGQDSRLEAVDDVLENLDEACNALLDAVHHDFSGYKQATLMRRIRRRMQVIGTGNAKSYVDRLRQDQKECEALLSDLLINVTRFFRDPDAFDLLEKDVIRPLAAGAKASDTLRVWVPGCSSGEEAYTLAMIFASALHGRESRPHVQIFATDIDEDVLAVAKLGRYPVTKLDEIPPRFREWCSVQPTGEFTVDAGLRDMVRFSAHSIIKDPPFSRLNLISCRNMLIYLGSKLQQGVMPLFHYALQPGGALFLGPAEGVGRREDLFAPVDRSARLYKRVPGATPDPVFVPLGLSRRPQRLPAPASGRPVYNSGMVGQRILDAYAPTHLVVSANGDLVESSGQLGRFLEIPAGTPTRQVPSMARPGLRKPLEKGLTLAAAENKRSVQRDIVVRSEFGAQTVDIVTDPLPDGSVLVVLRDIGAFRALTEDDRMEAEQLEQNDEAMARELSDMRSRLHTVIEELETANEELKTSNEEMMSMNEELQSSNEELSTVNDELKIKIDKLARANDDQANFMASTDMAMIVLGQDLQIRLFTDAAADIFPLERGDEGRPLSAFASMLDEDNLMPDIRSVLLGGPEVGRTVTAANGGRCYLMRILPYRTAHNAIEGVTLTFNDTTALDRARREAETVSARLELALSLTGVGVFELLPGAAEPEADDSVRRLFGVSEDEVTVDEFMSHIEPGDAERVMEAVGRVIEAGGDYREEFRVRDTSPQRWIAGAGRGVAHQSGGYRLLGVNYDITALKQAETQSQLVARELDHRVKNLFAVMLALAKLEARRTDDAKELEARLRERITALGRAHQAARMSGSEGADLHHLVSEVLMGAEAEIDSEGPQVRLPGSAITPLGLILFEMLTNARKHGALSASEGRVKVRWGRLRSGKLSLDWTETGGPPPDLPRDGSAQGFGTTLIAQSMRQLGGRHEFDWRESGLAARFTLSLKTS